MQHQIFENIVIPVLILERGDDNHFRYTWANEAVRKFTGLSCEDVVGHRATELFPDRVGSFMEWHQRAAAEARVPYTYQYTVKVPLGVKTIEACLVPVVEAGQVRQLVSNLIDRTHEQRLREEAILTDANRLHQVEEAERFIALAAHDLRAPMRNVRSIANMLREDILAGSHALDETLELVDMLSAVAEKAADLTSDVLSYARAGEIREIEEDFNLSLLCSDLFSMLDPSGEHELTAGTVTLRTDRTLAQIALRNLVDNALKHSGRRSVALDVTVRPRNHGMLEFSVVDNGVGFGDAAVALLGRGELIHESGFGLLGIKRMLASRGGQIWIKRRECQSGSAVSFTLPGVVLDPSVKSPDPMVCPPATSGQAHTA